MRPTFWEAYDICVNLFFFFEKNKRDREVICVLFPFEKNNRGPL
jgi:hypothetical protein